MSSYNATNADYTETNRKKPKLLTTFIYTSSDEDGDDSVPNTQANSSVPPAEHTSAAVRPTTPTTQVTSAAPSTPVTHPETATEGTPWSADDIDLCLHELQSASVGLEPAWCKYHRLGVLSSHRICYDPKFLHTFIIFPYTVDNRDWTRDFLSRVVHTVVPIDVRHKCRAASQCSHKLLWPRDIAVVESGSPIATGSGACWTPRETPRDSGYVWSAEQKKAYDGIRRIFDLTGRKLFTVMTVGPAGCGKTICLKQLLLDETIRFVYVTVQNNLCEDTKKKLGLSAESVSTLAAFIMKIYGLTFSGYRRLNNALVGVPVADVHARLKHLDALLNVTALRDILIRPDRANVVICVDEFSMINSNIIRLIQYALLAYGARHDGPPIVLLLCGDFYQIQPLFVCKTGDDPCAKPRRRCLRSYRYDTLTDNCKDLLALVDRVFEFTRQMRNDNAEYQRFLQELVVCKNRTIATQIFQQFPTRCHKRVITYTYPVADLLTLPRYPDSGSYKTYGTRLHEWLTDNVGKFNAFKFFSYTNVEAHGVNLNLYYSVLHQFVEYLPVTGRVDDARNKELSPRLADIFFSNGRSDRELYRGQLIETRRLPYLPLILGMQYKVLRSTDTLKHGQIVVLVHLAYNERDELDRLVVCRHDERTVRLYAIVPCHFSMNMFSRDNWAYAVRNSLRAVPENSMRLLYGFPLQLAAGDTVRGSIGMTVECDIYAHLGGCMIEEIYVLLSRTRNVENIKAIHLGVC